MFLRLRRSRLRSRLERFDEPMDPGCHYQEVPSWLSARVPVRVWRPSRNEERFPRHDLAIHIAETKSEAPRQDDPRLIV